LIGKFTERPDSRHPPIPVDKLQLVQAYLGPGGGAESSWGNPERNLTCGSVLGSGKQALSDPMQLAAGRDQGGTAWFQTGVIHSTPSGAGSLHDSIEQVVTCQQFPAGQQRFCKRPD
jgi:hypothetical protein